MTKKDYERAAKIVRELKTSKLMSPHVRTDVLERVAHQSYVVIVAAITNAFVELFTEGDRFDEARFREACGK